MRITPLDVRKQEFRRGVRGLDADEVYAFLATVADEYEVVLTDNKKLRDRVIELDEKLGEYRNMEKTLRDTLLTAERVMTEARQNARKEADLILRDAQMKASQEMSGINGRVEALHQQLRELRGHRDSYIARLHALSEAQLGLIESYRKDFEVSDHRIEAAAGPAGSANRSTPQDGPAKAPAPSIPTWDRHSGSVAPVAPPDPQDQWRGYDVGAAPSGGRPHLHTSDPEDAELRLEADDLPDPRQSAGKPGPTPAASPASGHDERVSSVADAWSGSVPPVENYEPAEGEARAIDEVSAALGMFSEGSDALPEPAPLEGESRGVPPVAGAGTGGNELAPGGIPTEPVQHAGNADPSAPGTIEAAAGSDPDEQTEEGQGRWSLSRIARGLTGH